MVQQVALSLDGSLAASSCGADGLTVGGVGTVACHKDAGQLGAWRAVNLLQIACLVSIQPFLEDIGIGLVADGEEETVNLDVYQFFIGLTLAFDKVCSLDAVLAKESQRVVLEQAGRVCGQ